MCNKSLPRSYEHAAAWATRAVAAIYTAVIVARAPGERWTLALGAILLWGAAATACVLRELRRIESERGRRSDELGARVEALEARLERRDELLATELQRAVVRATAGGDVHHLPRR